MAKTYRLENLKSLDFELWSKLAMHDPGTFESMRLAMIEDLIKSAPPARRQRLRCLQWRIDQERRLSHSPLSACIRISRLMWDNLVGEDGLMDHLQNLNESLNRQPVVAAKPVLQATVIPFRSKQH